MSDVVLHSYWRSSCSWRVRIALHLKGIKYESIPINLAKKENLLKEYREFNPEGFVPVLEHNGNVITQSLAILEYLDEVFPEKKLIYGTPGQKALIRSLALVIIADIQPIQNPSVQEKYGGNDMEKKANWAKYFIERGFSALEKKLQKTAKKYAIGDEISLVDICIPSQVYNARRFNVDMSLFPTISRLNDFLSTLPEFESANEKHQADTPADYAC